MIALEDRQALVQDIGAAQSAGARLSKACEVCGIDRRTLHRWKADALALQSGDRRPLAIRPTPAHALPSMSGVDSKIWIRPEAGPANSCTGTTSSICTAESATSVRTSGMPAKTKRFWLHGLTCISQRKPPTQRAGLAIPENGRRSAPSLSTLKNQSSSKRNHPIKINRQSPHNSWDNHLDMRRPRDLHPCA